MTVLWQHRWTVLFLVAAVLLLTAAAIGQAVT